MGYWLFGILIGGIIISSLGALSTYTLEEKNPTIKSISRDFIIGSILSSFILYLLPESTLSVLTYLSGVIPLSSIISATPSIEDSIEVEVGIPKF